MTGVTTQTLAPVSASGTGYIDKRESILARLVEIFKAINGIKTVMRNRTAADVGTSPAIIILDADESLNLDRAPAGPHTQSPIMIDMRPEIYFFHTDHPEDIGEQLNIFRRRIIKAVLTDKTIRDLCVQAGVTFDGYATALAMGRKMDAQSAFQFTFTYVLRPDDL